MTYDPTGSSDLVWLKYTMRIVSGHILLAVCII